MFKDETSSAPSLFLVTAKSPEEIKTNNESAWMDRGIYKHGVKARCGLLFSSVPSSSGKCLVKKKRKRKRGVVQFCKAIPHVSERDQSRSAWNSSEICFLSGESLCQADVTGHAQRCSYIQFSVTLMELGEINHDTYYIHCNEEMLPEAMLKLFCFCRTRCGSAQKFAIICH